MGVLDRLVRMGLISVGVGSAQENYGVKYRVLPGRQTGGGEGWTHQHTFMAHDAPVPGTVPLCIGMTWDAKNTVHKGQRYLVKYGTDASGNGWIHDGLVHVFTYQMPGTEPYSVGHSQPVWRYKIVPGMNAGGQGWVHDFTFWAFKSQDGGQNNPPAGGNHGNHGGTTVMSVGRNQQDYGSKFCVMEGNHDGSWEHVFKFKVWKNNEPGMTPISVGNTGPDGGWRWKLAQGRRGAVNSRFHHSNTFFAYTYHSPGT